MQRGVSSEGGGDWKEGVMEGNKVSEGGTEMKLD